MMYGWRITGRRGADEATTFMVATHTTELEEAIAAGLRELARPSLGAQVPYTIEVEVSEAEFLGQFTPSPLLPQGAG